MTAPAPLFVSRDATARLLDCSPNFVGSMTARGELNAWHLGGRVLYGLPALQLRALGISTPAQIGELCRGLGVKSLPDLLAWLSPAHEAQKA